MAKASFAYVPIRARATSDIPVRFRPMVNVTLTTADGATVRSAALADSGADACLFPLQIAKTLGVRLDRLPMASTSGVGSSNNVTYYVTLLIDLGEGIRFRTLAGFTEGLDSAGFGLLGQQGFFENYIVEFRLRDGVFTVESV